MRKNGIADENIAKMMNLDIYIVKKVLNREEIEIPLNLLTKLSDFLLDLHQSLGTTRGTLLPYDFMSYYPRTEVGGQFKDKRSED